jgi:hypothetical protein
MENYVTPPRSSILRRLLDFFKVCGPLAVCMCHVLSAVFHPCVKYGLYVIGNKPKWVPRSPVTSKFHYTI